MPEKKREKVSKYNLITGEDTYASQTAQNPGTSRRVQSWIPLDDGALYRELPEPFYINQQLPGEVKGLYEFDQNDTNGNVVRFFFAVAATAPGASTFKLYQNVAGVWTQVTIVGTLQGVPQFVTLNNLLHMADGSTSWIFDGLSWLPEGFAIVTGSSAIDTSLSGTFSCLVGRYYWLSFADHTVNRSHESTAQNASLITGPLTNKKVTVFQQSGLFTATTGSPTVSTSNSTDSPGPVAPNLQQSYVGMVIYINGTLIGTILSIVGGTITLTANYAGGTITNGRAVIVPSRATHWHIYASESDGSKIGQFLAAIPVTTSSYQDQSPFAGQANTLFASIFRPVRNDPPQPSGILTVHKYRIWRRHETKPNLFNFCANEEVVNNGNPQECVPGVDPNTQSDIINEEPYPDSSNRIRNMVSHGDALYIGTEKNTVPLWGESLDDFAISQVNAFSVGIAGKFASVSTKNGLVFMSYDRKVYLYPTSNYPWAYVPKDVNVTEQLIEIGKPMRKRFEQISYANLDQVRFTKYAFGRRDWLVVSYMDINNNYFTWVYDFGGKGWFQLQRGFASIAVFEVQNGIQILVGGGSDGFVYVIDDLSGTYPATGNMPQAVWRPALIDFGDPDSKHVPRYVEFEVTNAAMASDIAVNYYLDPKDVDNPGTPRQVELSQVRGSNLWRGFFKGGNLCQRLLLEFNAQASPASTNSGALRGAKLVADKASALVF